MPPLGLDPDHRLGCRVQVVSRIRKELCDQSVQAGDANLPFRQSSSGQDRPGLVDQLDVVVILGPVISYEEHPLRLQMYHSRKDSSAEEMPGDLMAQVLTESSGARHPSSGHHL